MILRSLRVVNFRQICGEYRVEFAPPGGRSITVVLGDNAAGKTTLLNAFTWCLYGRVKMAEADKILSYKAIQDAAIGATLKVEVTLVFESDGNVYTVSRFGEYRKEDGGRLSCLSSPDVVRVDRVASSGVATAEQDPKRFINLTMPEGLSSFFFFRGEDMEKLALSEAAAGLREGVEVFLDVKVLDSAYKHSAALKSDIEAEIRAVSRGDVKEISDRIEQSQQKKAGLENTLAETSKNLATLETTKETIDAALAKVDQVRPFLEEQRALKKELDVLENDDLPKRVASLCAVISKDAFLWPSSDALETPVQLAEAAVTRGDLPASIKPVFVDDRIKLGVCICGTKLDEPLRGALLEWKKIAGLALIDEEVTELRSACSNALAQRREDSWSNLERERAALAELRQRMSSVRGRLSAVTTELEGKDFGLDEVAAWQERLRTVVNDIIEAKSRKLSLAGQIEALTEIIDELEKERKRKTAGQGEADRLARQASALSNVSRAVQQMKDGWVAIVQRYLDSMLKATWGEIAQLDRLVEFTPEFRLSMKELGGHREYVTAAPSQANEVALSLAFIASLVRFSRAIADFDKKDAGTRRLFHGGDFPVVMDAPFAKLDRDFKEKIPEGLKKVVPQIVLITNHEHWKGVVEERLGASVGKKYVLELHRPGDGEDGARVAFLGDMVDYVVSEPKAVRDWSVIREVSR